MIPDDAVDSVVNGIIENKRRYYRIALSFCRNRNDSLDAISEMTVAVLEKYDRLKDKAAFPSWSATILVNICRKYIRRRKRILFLEDMDGEPVGADPDSDLSLDMRKALASISPAHKEVIILKDLLQFTYREIAAQLRIPVGTAQSRYAYGIKSLRRALGGHYNEES